MNVCLGVHWYTLFFLDLFPQHLLHLCHQHTEKEGEMTIDACFFFHHEECNWHERACKSASSYATDAIQRAISWILQRCSCFTSKVQPWTYSRTFDSMVYYCNHFWYLMCKEKPLMHLVNTGSKINSMLICYMCVCKSNCMLCLCVLVLSGRALQITVHLNTLIWNKWIYICPCHTTCPFLPLYTRNHFSIHQVAQMAHQWCISRIFTSHCSVHWDAIRVYQLLQTQFTLTQYVLSWKWTWLSHTDSGVSFHSGSHFTKSLEQLKQHAGYSRRKGGNG